MDPSGQGTGQQMQLQGAGAGGGAPAGNMEAMYPVTDPDQGSVLLVNCIDSRVKPDDLFKLFGMPCAQACAGLSFGNEISPSFYSHPGRPGGYQWQDAVNRRRLDTQPTAVGA